MNENLVILQIRMTDFLTPAQRHLRMSQIHSSNTKPEVKLRHALWKRGFRYKVNDKRLSGSPDIVLPKYRTVVFVHGCFWHGHKGCKNYTVPKTNTDFWLAKVKRNQERDQEVWRKLEAKEWSVIIVWECELEKKRIDTTISRVACEIKSNGELFQQRQLERKVERERRRIERTRIKDAIEAGKAEIKVQFGSHR